MDLSKIEKEDLEDIVCDILDELKVCEVHLFEKFSEMLEDILYGIDETEAVDIVHSFKPNGETFSMERIKEILHKYGINENACIDYYLTMNMFYNDYKSYAESKRLDLQDFCFEMSKLFINDTDAPKHKVAKYFKMFVEDDDIEDEE